MCACMKTDDLSLKQTGFCQVKNTKWISFIFINPVSFPPFDSKLSFPTFLAQNQKSPSNPVALFSVWTKDCLGCQLLIVQK